jgi:hypothetical protein
MLNLRIATMKGASGIAFHESLYSVIARSDEFIS